MSLKNFHLFFIIAATFLSLGCGIWFLRLPTADEAAASNQAWGCVCLVLGLGLAVYGVYFVRKMRQLGPRGGS